jgi:hypothetical protein
MATTAQKPQAEPVKIDFAALQAQAKQMAQQNPDEMRKKLEVFRTRQLTQQKKQQSKGSQAVYNKKRNEEFKAMKAEAQSLPASDPQYPNLWAEIEAQSKKKAQANFDEWLDAQDEDAGEPEEAEAK